MGKDPLSEGNSRRWIMAEVEHSLKRLKTDYIDLYQIHRPDESTDIEETLGALSDLVHLGKIRYFGSSTSGRTDRRRPVGGRATRLRALPHRAASYSILVRGIERDVLPTAQSFGMGVIPGAHWPVVGSRQVW